MGEIPENFPNSKMVLTVVQSSPGTQQIWGMIEEAKTFLKLLPPAAYMYDERMTKLKQFCSGKVLVFVHPLKLTFPGDIDGLSLEDIIKTKVGQGSMGQGIGVFTSAIINPGSQT